MELIILIIIVASAFIYFRKEAVEAVDSFGETVHNLCEISNQYSAELLEEAKKTSQENAIKRKQELEALEKRSLEEDNDQIDQTAKQLIAELLEDIELNTDDEVSTSDDIFSRYNIKKVKLKDVKPNPQELKSIKNISFEKIRRYYANLVKENKADAMAIEFTQNAKLYKALVYDALEQFIYKIHQNEITIVDWGCSQGLGAALVLDYIKEKQLNLYVTQVILVDNNADALSKAVLHCDVLKQNELEIISLDTHNGMEKFNKLKNKVALHLCVNDKNIVNFRDIELDKCENDYFLCLSNKNATIINAIYNQIHSLYETIIISDRKTKVGRYEKYEKIFQIQEIPF